VKLRVLGVGFWVLGLNASARGHRFRQRVPGIGLWVRWWSRRFRLPTSLRPVAVFVLALTAVAWGQTFTQRGFLETDFIGYPQTAPDDSGQAVGEALFRYEAFYKLSSDWQFAGGFDARADTHGQVDRDWELSWDDRERRRPSFAVRQLNATYSKNKLTLELGKQFIRWGKADLLNPTDRFAPRDFLTVVDADFLAVTAARLTYGGQSNTIELVWCPLFTPSRVPLLNQRWSIVPEGVSLVEQAPVFPGGSQFGARWNHIGAVAEYSLSFYDGHNNLPLFNFQLEPQAPLTVDIQEFYPQMRMYGGDAAVPLKGVTVKVEAAYFTSTTKTEDEYALFVAQVEKQAGEWFFIGGYAGEAITLYRPGLQFAPDRGLARAFLGHAGYTIDTNRSVSLETAIRQNGRGEWATLAYSQAFGQHWRATAGYTLIRGDSSDFLGQYRRNSHAMLALRYSF